MPSAAELRKLLAEKAPTFWQGLREATGAARSFEELFYLSRLRARAAKEGAPREGQPTATIRVALLSGYTS